MTALPMSSRVPRPLLGVAMPAIKWTAWAHLQLGSFTTKSAIK